jgi:hypothetical protein
MKEYWKIAADGNNVNNTIAGAGTMADLNLNNEKLGVVDATGAVNQLIIDNAIANAGLFEGTGAAGLQLADVVTNSATGTIEGRHSRRPHRATRQLRGLQFRRRERWPRRHAPFR